MEFFLLSPALADTSHVRQSRTEDTVKERQLSQDSDEEPIPEIMALKEGEVLPDFIIKKYSSKRIAYSLVERLHLERKSKGKRVDNFLYFYDEDKNFLKDAQIQLAFNEKYLESIQKDCFLNQHQTGTSGGLKDQARRRRLENAMMNVKLENPADSTLQNKLHEVLPKYAYLDIQPSHVDESGLTERHTMYGNLVAVLKDEVKKRSTWTPGDSLNVNATHEAVFDFKYDGNKPALKQPMGWYFETQIWGPVCMEDVAHFLVNCPGMPGVSAETIAKLKAAGHKLYKCEAKDLAGDIYSNSEYTTADQWRAGALLE